MAAKKIQSGEMGAQDGASGDPRGEEITDAQRAAILRAQGNAGADDQDVDWDKRPAPAAGMRPRTAVQASSDPMGSQIPVGDDGDQGISLDDSQLMPDLDEPVRVQGESDQEAVIEDEPVRVRDGQEEGAETGGSQLYRGKQTENATSGKGGTGKKGAIPKVKK